MAKKLILTISLWLLFSLNLISGAVAATISLSDGWNLVSSRYTITTTDTFSSADSFISIWKWTTENNWAVYLPGQEDGGESYASSKGFTPLTAINPGEGFWVNSDGAQDATVTGTETTSNTLSLISGWNLKGLAISSSINVSSVFSDSDKFISVWKWSSNKWAVYLPGQEDGGESYAGSKGFTLLTSVNPGEGFWVNAGSGQSVNVAETPPLVGKVSEVVGKNDKNSYKAVPGATVSIDGTSVGKTDSSGKFETTDYSGSSVKVDVQLSGYVPFSETVTIPESNQIYIFIQKEDTNSETLEKTQEGASKLGLSPLKPTPKVITSSDGTTSLTITNMQLTSDITVAVTPYNSLNTIPDTETIDELELGKVDIVGGGYISIVDANGDPITSADAGFSASVTPKTTKTLGKWTIDKIGSKIGSSDTDKLYVLSKTSGGWKKLGLAKVEQKENSSVKTMVPESGVVMSSLSSFVFVMSTTATQQVQENQITGKVVEKGNTTKGIPGVFVGVDGFFTESITDDSGNFALDFHIIDATTLNLQVLFLYAWKDGYYAGSKEIPITALSTDLSNVTMELEPFGDVLDIEGHIKDISSNNPVENAVVTLKTPSVLDEIYFEEDKVYVGKDDQAYYKWEIMDQPEELFGEPTVLKTIQAKGKNFFGLDDVQDLLAEVPEGETEIPFLISLEVTHKVGQGEFKEHAGGFGFVDLSGDEPDVMLDFIPDFTNFSIMEAWTDSDGYYQFSDVEKSLVPFLKASAKMSGYKPAVFSELPAAQGGVITKDFTLQEQVKATDYLENFETGATGWTTKVESGGQEINSNTKWQLLENPEQIVMPSDLLNNVLFADIGWVDVDGTIGKINIDTTQSDDFWKVGKATVTFLKGGQVNTLQALLYDYGGGEDYLPDGKYDYIEWDYTVDQDYYDLWYDFSNVTPSETNEFWSMNLVEGSKIKVSYQGVPEGQEAGLNLLAAFSGSHVYWIGNQDSADYKGTYYDPQLETEENIVNAILQSPPIDLTDFSYAKLQLNTWFEVNGANFSSMGLEVALMDEDLEFGQEVTLEAEYGDVTVKKGEFVPLFQFNPFVTLDLGAFMPEGSGSSPLQKTSLPKKKALTKEFIDENSDGKPDDWDEWADQYACADALKADTYGYGNEDGDDYLNIDEYFWGGNPCEADPDEDFDGMADSWEESWQEYTTEIDLDPWADPDGDYFTNADEFWMGSNPFDENDPFQGGGEAPMGFEDYTIGLSSGGEFAPPVWTPFEFNLGPYAGHKIMLTFKFSFVNASTNLFRGWAIDDVKITDEESDQYFEIMTPEFGNFGDYYFEEIEQGESWTGNYQLSLTEAFSLDMNNPDATETEYTQDSQQITVTQTDLYVETSINFAGVPCTVEGNFWDESYDYLNFWFYDTETEGMEMWGWGELSFDSETGPSGNLEVYKTTETDFIYYWGNIALSE